MATPREIREVTYRRALLKAVGKILKQGSYAKLGINTVSEEAKVDKTFIYRKYGDFTGLLNAYLEKKDFWLIKFDEIKKLQVDDHRVFMKEMLRSQFNEILSNEEFQQFLVWELGDKEGLTNKVAIERELLAEDLLEQTRLVLDDVGVNLNNIYALFIAGVYYLILHRDRSTFCKLDITEKQGVDDLLNTLDWLIDTIFDKKEALSKLEESIFRAHAKGLEVHEISHIFDLPEQKVCNLLTTANKVNS